PTILVYGDSLSAAYGIPREQGWVALLQQRLKDEGLTHQVVNTSISGETTTGGSSRIAATLKAHQPDIVLIELGANDGLRGLPLTDMQNNLKQMIEACQQAKARVVLVGMMLPPNYGPRYAREFNQTYTNLAKEYRLALVPFLLADVAGKPALNQDDGLHPTAQAQPQVLGNVWSILQSVLVSQKAR
ncbi:MAG: arylesterase, partial [Methylophilaceae bacterium]